ncbi:hypothetical protein B0T17DRAFT_593557 [Bombardia bombarda]|uniref:Uncharacterized protein n=1 Tax=Bombardia bombarda TaxID=252184 RepID=A0AA39U2H9_9PEZI|nr:hypothetical protein B0T17DRAFT_593557 [Bombardia bombarda]
MLNLTAIGAAHGESTIECWQLGPFTSASIPGIVGAQTLLLGDMASANYTVIPPRFDSEPHNAPAVQLVFFISGLIHVTLPNSTDEAWIHGGKYGLIIAADTAERSAHGHFTTYPGNEATVSLVVPLREGYRLKYRLLHGGACGWEDMEGL